MQAEVRLHFKGCLCRFQQCPFPVTHTPSSHTKAAFEDWVDPIDQHGMWLNVLPIFSFSSAPPCRVKAKSGCHLRNTCLHKNLSHHCYKTEIIRQVEEITSKGIVSKLEKLLPIRSLNAWTVHCSLPSIKLNLQEAFSTDGWGYDLWCGIGSMCTLSFISLSRICTSCCMDGRCPDSSLDHTGTSNERGKEYMRNKQEHLNYSHWPTLCEV